MCTSGTTAAAAAAAAALLLLLLLALASCVLLLAGTAPLREGLQCSDDNMVNTALLHVSDDTM
jgi:hypothetical protein